MIEQVTCFLPCRKGSERVPRKNIKPFAEYTKGLVEIKLKQLCASERVEKVVLSTNDHEILEYAKSLNNKKIELHLRSECLSSSETSTDALVGHALDLIPSGHVLWTHVTSPFVTAKHYDQIIQCYFEQIVQGFDSLMTTTEIQGFIWDDKGPINYDRNKEKWPRTQTLKPVHEINSGAFLASRKVYSNLADRVGKRPFLYPLDKLTSYDIDWPQDFLLAECILEKNLVEV